MRLVRQAESNKEYLGRRYGLSLYENQGGDFEAVFHTRTYDGIRVADKWDTPHISMGAPTSETAWDEAVAKWSAYIKAVHGQG